MNSRCKRALQYLTQVDRVFVRDLRQIIGASNPAQNIFLLRKLGWNIRTGKINMTDRDGSKCHPGYYWLNDEEKFRAIDFLQKANEAATTAPKAKDTSNCPGENPSSYDNTGGEKNDHLL